MGMPKGFKSENGYATFSSLGGKSYHQIADEMTSKGYKMNHSTSRNIFISGMMKLARSVAETQGLKLTDADIKKIAKSPLFQESVSELINFDKWPYRIYLW